MIKCVEDSCISANLYQKCLILYSKIILHVLHNNYELNRAEGKRNISVMVATSRAAQKWYEPSALGTSKIGTE